MKTHSTIPSTFLAPLAFIALILTGCSTPPKKPAPPTAAVSGSSHSKSPKAGDDLDEYKVETIPDPIEPVNRVTFWVNDQLYTYVLRPISKTYERVIPKPVRTGVYNAFDNVEFPVRFVNDALQGKFDRAGLETGRFLVNSTLGIGGLGRPSNHIPALAHVPPGETGQTFQKWGIPHGFYLVLPILGPSSLRDTVGLAGDYALSPVTWVSIVFGGYTWLIAISSTDTLTGLPNKFQIYDAATKNSLDRYLAARTAYSQYRSHGSVNVTPVIAPAPTPTPTPAPTRGKKKHASS